MKHTIRRGLSADGLRASLPVRYRALMPADLSDPGYTLILFRADRNDVVLSREVEAALASVVGDTEPLVAVGGCFTAEGREMLQARRATVLQLSDFYWTDESYRSIRERKPR